MNGLPHVSVTYSGGSPEDMAVKDVEEVRPEIDHRSLTDNFGLLAEREVFVPGSERTGRGKGTGFVAKR